MEKLIIGLCLAAAISGCTSTKKTPVDEESLSIYQQKIIEENRRTEEVLSKAAALSAKAIAVFVRTEQALHQKDMTAEQIRQARFQNDYIPVNMEQKVQYSWDFAPEPLLSALASNAGYVLKYRNKRPAITKSVTASEDSRTINDYINIIRQQTEGYIDFIYVDDKTDEKTINVYYSRF